MNLWNFLNKFDPDKWMKQGLTNRNPDIWDLVSYPKRLFDKI